MILFIHGFGSCGWGEKSLCLRRHFGVAGLLAPDLPTRPAAAVAQLRNLIRRYPITALVGSSLGGFYATALNRDARLPAVLINPVVQPQRLLADYRGPQQRWCDGMPFAVDDVFLAELGVLTRDRLDPAEHYLVLLQQGDEVLDYRVAAAFYAAKDLVVLPGGDHRFSGLRDHLTLIDDWLGRYNRPGH